jgi:hypothetical protein
MNHVTNCYHASVGQIRAEPLSDLDDSGSFGPLFKFDHIREERSGPAHGSQCLLPVDLLLLFGGDDPYGIVSRETLQLRVCYKSFQEDLGPEGFDSGQAQLGPAQDEGYNGSLQVGQLPQGVYGCYNVALFGGLYGLPLLLDMGIEALRLRGSGELLQGFQAFFQPLALLGEESPEAVFELFYQGLHVLDSLLQLLFFEGVLEAFRNIIDPLARFAADLLDGSFELRLDELIIIECLRKLEKAAIKPDSQVTFHKDFGQELYGKVLVGELGIYFQKQLQANAEGLRISLQFDDEAQKLATLPWEFLHDGEDFFVARRNTLISRMPSKMKKVQSVPLESVLRMLVIVSAPQDPSCHPLDTEKERDRIQQAVDKLHVQHKMEIDFTDDATFETIQSYLNEKDYHIVHFIGHGTEVDGQGFLILENEDLTANKVGNQTVADLFAGRGIRLVVLNACESVDLADKLVRKGVPAVVAMQYSILDPSATGFAFAFYQALASGRAIDLSLTEARLAMRNAKESNRVDFATPVLYLLDAVGHLFAGQVNRCLRVGRKAKCLT